MRALISGATGFLGSRLTARLAADGHDVHALVRPQSDLGPLASVGANVALHPIDPEGGNLGEIVRASRPDVVFHTAALVMAEHGPDDVAPLIGSNLLFPCQLVDAMVRHGVPRLVNCGTAWQHYDGADYSPVCLYAATKQAFLSLLRYYAEASGLAVVDLTLSDTYGPGDRRPKLFSLLYRAATSREPLAFSAGEQVLDILYIDDVLDACQLAAARLLEHQDHGIETYSIPSDHPLGLRDLVATFSEVTGLYPNIAWGARAYRAREMMRPWRGGTALPGWRPKVPLADGIRRLHASRDRSC